MSVDEQATIRSILEALSKEGTALVAKQIQGISEKSFRTALKTAGYDYNNKTPKGWHYVGEGEQPLDKSIFDYVKPSSPRKKSNSPKVISDNTEVIISSPLVHQQFTNDEVSMIKEMLFEWQRVATQEATHPHEPQREVTLHDRIKQLPQNDKTRKTIVLDQSIGKQLDEFCQAERVNKSDVLHLALMDFLKRW